MISATEQRITVTADGRSLTSLVLLPDEPSHHPMPFLVALHNFANSAKGFADLINARRITAAGIVVVLPQAGSLVPEWQGLGLTITLPARRPGSGRIDDMAALEATVAAVKRRYGVDPCDLNVAGFSQGATAALELARRLDVRRPGTVRRVFTVAGSLAAKNDSSLALRGTTIVRYEPGHNWPQDVANFFTGSPGPEASLRDVATAKSCELSSVTNENGIRREIYRCGDGRSLVRLFELSGEHAWPGQAKRHDSSFTGRGSISALDMTGLVVADITRGTRDADECRCSSGKR